MTQPQGVAVAIIMPPPGTFTCPFLPPIPQVSKMTGAVNAIQPLPCVGEQCAIYDGCQGKFSPRAAARRAIESKIGYCESLLGLLEKARSMPMFGTTMEAAIVFVNEYMNKLKDDLIDIAPRTASTPLPNADEIKIVPKPN